MSNTTTNNVSYETDNKRIIKNSSLLYVRMLLLMVVNLYTARIVLEALGVIDYGVYNAIGGFIASFSIISASISSAISRYITFSLGEKDQIKTNKIFCISITILLVFCCLIILCAETFGLWFLHEKMTIPPESYNAAFWVYQFSLITFVLNIISIPYSSLIIAHEKMNIYAYIGIIEGAINLGIAYLITLHQGDRLSMYAALICAAALVIRIIYGIICGRNFQESKFKWIYDKTLISELFKFTGWTFIGTASGVLRNQGINILYNIYYGPVVNAAYGLSSQIFNAVNKFANNFYTAVQPQITKSFAAEDRYRSFDLVVRSCRMAYFLLLLISIPLLCETQQIISLWLTTIPDDTLSFTRVMVLFCLVEAFSQPLIYLVLATGNIKKYQLIVGGVNLLNFPVAWMMLYYGCHPTIVQYSVILFALICLFLRLAMLKQLIAFPVLRFINETLVKSAVTTVIVFIILFMVIGYINTNNSIADLILNTLLQETIAVIIIYCFGLTKNERKFLVSRICHR